MGWRPDGGIWEIGRGGQLAFGKGTGNQAHGWWGGMTL